MDKENIKILLLIIFGFAFISAIDSLLGFIVFLIFILSSELGISYYFLNFFLPIISLVLYSLTTLLFIKTKYLKSVSKNIFLFKNSIIAFIGFVIIALIMNPIRSKLSALYLENKVELENYSLADYYEVLGWMYFGENFSLWLILFILIISFRKKIMKIGIKN